MIPQATLQEVQTDPGRLRGVGVTTLAWLMHEAESANDDLTFMAIQDVIADREKQTPGGEQIVRDEYMRLWPEHAAARGYGKPAVKP